MPQYEFVAVDDDGNERHGMVEARNRSSATQQIRGYGLKPARVRPSRQRSGLRGDATTRAPGKKPLYFGRGIQKKPLTEFTRKLATLLKAGLTLLRSLEVLLDQERNVVSRWVLSSVADGIRSGSTFSESLEKFPKDFDFLYISMVRAGEASGTLDVSLDRLASYMEKTQKMKAKLVSAMVYPSVVMTISTLIVLALLLFVVPRYERIFMEELGGQQMPLLTRVVLDISQFMWSSWYVIVSGFAGSFLLWRLFVASSLGRRCVDWLKLKLPIAGDLFLKTYIIRFCRTLGTLMVSGVPILGALAITRDTIGNQVVMDAVTTVRSRVKDGEGIARPLESTEVFPLMVTSMIEVGEETGGVDRMLTQVGDVYEEEVDNTLNAMTSIVEPIMIVMLALMIGTIVLAIFLPFVKVLQSFGAG